MRARWLVAGATAVAVAVGGGTAVAMQDAKVIRACVHERSGAVRITDDGCRREEDRLAWNRVGPMGPAGPAGPAGPDGAPGEDAAIEIHELPGSNSGQPVVEGGRQFAGIPVIVDVVVGQRGTLSASASFSGEGGATLFAEVCYRALDPTAEVLPLAQGAGEQSVTVESWEQESLSVHQTWVMEETGSFLFGICVRRTPTPGEIFTGGTRGFMTVTG